jgi:MoaA/NifB/PqqE/SkfB family radical SAM enzyme
MASQAEDPSTAEQPPRPRAPEARLDPARWSSILALDHAYAAGAVRLAAGPLEAYVEVSARCNLRCRMCPITVDPRYDPHSGNPPLLSRELFARLAPVLPTLQRVYLMGLGEPFLNRDLIAYAETLAKAGVEIWITTNATLVSEATAEAVARAGVTRVTVSVDGATAATYERIRRRGRFEHLLRGLRALGEVRRRYGRPQLFLNVIAMAGNLQELPALIDLCADAGGDGVHLEGLYDWPELEDFSRRESLDQLAPEQVEELLAEARRRAAARGISFFNRLDELARFASSARQALPRPVPAGAGSAQAGEPAPLPAPSSPLPSPIAAAAAGAAAAGSAGRTGAAPPPPPAGDLKLPWACSEPWTTINVNAAGEVRPCCFNDQLMGHVGQQPFAAIWNGPDYQRLRADHLAGRVPASCAQCVRNGRVKRSAFLAPHRQPGDVPSRPVRGARLLAPAAGELIAGPLVVAGELPPRAQPGMPHSRAELPELHMDGGLLVRLRDFAMIEGHRFAAVIAIPWVTEGSHVLSLAAPRPAAEGAAGWAGQARGDSGSALNATDAGPMDAWEHRRLQVGRIAGQQADLTAYAHHQIPPAPAMLAAVTRLALALALEAHESAPALYLAGRRHRLAAWLCGRHAEHWLGVALVDVGALRPGSYPLELRLRRHSPVRHLLERL